MTTDCDIVIIGAGMVGATLAAICADAGLRVAVIESAPPALTWPDDTVDLRVSAVTAASERIFTAIGLWPSMQALGVSPFREMHVWDAGGSGEIRFDCADLGEARLGHIVENRVIQRVLFEHLQQQQPSVTIHCPAALERIDIGSDTAGIGLSDGTSITARLVVGADGANSKTRALAGIAVGGWSYEQKGVVTHCATEHPHQATARQRFLTTGPLAFLPLRDGRCSIVWSTTPDHADALLSAAPEAFMTELGAAFDHRLGAITAIDRRAAFPLRLQYAKNYCADRLALIGDAAHAIHPLAGQGVNLGLLDAAALAEVVLEAAADARDFGSTAVLRRYERWRKGDNLLMMMTMDGFKRLFGADVAPLRLARNLGLDLVNGLPAVKHRIIRHAMGLTGDLPRLARQAVL